MKTATRAFVLKLKPNELVEKKIEDHLVTAKAILPLWNSLRDAVGEAVTDFQSVVHGHSVSRADCTAHGPQCMRVQKLAYSSRSFSLRPIIESK